MAPGEDNVYNQNDSKFDQDPLASIRLKLDDFYRKPDNSEKFFYELTNLLSKKLDVNLSVYRENFIHRRIYYRLLRLNISSYKDYLQYIQQHPEEIEIFRDIFTIHVTEFFRDELPFRYLEKELFHEIAQGKRNLEDKTIRILSAPCSSGEEAYSVAIIIDHLKREHLITNPCEILACDIDSKVIIFAQKGIYAKETLKNISAASLLQNFIQLDSDHYRIKPAIRNYIQFYEQDLLKPLCLTGIDLVVCRNFLIYISKENQKIVINNLIKCMNVNAFLMLGKTEGFPLLSTSLFTPKNLREHIYQYSPH